MSNPRIRQSGKRWPPMIAVAALVVGTLVAASPLAAEESRWTVAAKVGQASVQGDFGPGILGWRVDDDDTAAGIEVGYFPHHNLGIQAGYHDLGSYAGQPGECPRDTFCPATLAVFVIPVFPVEANFTGYSLAAIPRWPVTERFSAYGKVGVLDWKGDLSPAFDAGRIAAPSGTDFLAGLGAQYAFSRGFTMQVEYETSDLFDRVSLGTGWRF